MSKKGIAELANLFRERDNPRIMTVGVGKVISPLPNLRIQFGDRIILESEDLVVSASLTNGYTGEVGGSQVTVKMTLDSGDDVILIPTADMQKYYVLDKVGV